jgi:hypothetical protein
MQFIPSTWSVVGVDADGDSERNPQDIDDAALATGVYLCSGTENLGTRQGQETAVYRYNHSHSYVNLVLRIMDAYSQGEYTAIPSGTYGGTLFTPSYTAAIDNQQRANTVAGERPGAQAPRAGSGSSGGSSPTPGGDNGGTPGTGGDDGTDSPLPGTPGTEDPGTPDNPVTKPLTDALDEVTTTVTEAASPVAEPVVDVLTSTEALNLCSSQFAAIPDPLGLLKPLKDNCAAKVEGKTEADALALIPNTLDGILAWLT